MSATVNIWLFLMFIGIGIVAGMFIQRMIDKKNRKKQKMIDRKLLLEKAIAIKEELLEVCRKQLGQPDEVGKTEDNKVRTIELENELKELRSEHSEKHHKGNPCYNKDK